MRADAAAPRAAEPAARRAAAERAAAAGTDPRGARAAVILRAPRRAAGGLQLRFGSSDV